MRLVTMRGQASDLGSNWLLTGNLDFSRDYLRSHSAGHDRRHQPASLGCTCSDGLLHGGNAGADRQARWPKSPHRRWWRKTREKSRSLFCPTGLRLLVREDSRLPLVYLDAVFRGGLLAETSADNGLTKLFSRVLLKGNGKPDRRGTAR